MSQRLLHIRPPAPILAISSTVQSVQDAAALLTRHLPGGGAHVAEQAWTLGDVFDETTQSRVLCYQLSGNSVCCPCCQRLVPEVIQAGRPSAWCSCQSGQGES